MRHGLQLCGDDDYARADLNQLSEKSIFITYPAPRVFTSELSCLALRRLAVYAFRGDIR